MDIRSYTKINNKRKPRRLEQPCTNPTFLLSMSHPAVPFPFSNFYVGFLIFLFKIRQRADQLTHLNISCRHCKRHPPLCECSCLETGAVPLLNRNVQTQDSPEENSPKRIFPLSAHHIHAIILLLPSTGRSSWTFGACGRM